MASNEIHSPKELELMAKVKALEEDRIKFIEIVRGKMKKLEIELVVSSVASWNLIKGYLNLYLNNYI